MQLNSTAKNGTLVEVEVEGDLEAIAYIVDTNIRLTVG